jgi:hypothetical protein
VTSDGEIVDTSEDALENDLTSHFRIREADARQECIIEMKVRLIDGLELHRRLQCEFNLLRSIDLQKNIVVDLSLRAD